MLHIPSCRATLERAYGAITRGDEPSSTDLMLLLACFASAAFTGTPNLLKSLNATEDEARAAHMTYMRLATALLDNKYNPVVPSASSFAATATVFSLTTHATGFSDISRALRMRCHGMAQQMQVHLLDTKKSRDERLLKGCNAIDIELQRRVWWHLVGHDW